MSKHTRTMERFEGGEWKPVDWFAVIKGDRVRVLEEDGTIINNHWGSPDGIVAGPANKDPETNYVIVCDDPADHGLPATV